MYFIKRGPRPEHHRAPYHQYIVCSRKKLAKWEAGSTSDRAWMWWHEDGEEGSMGGWLLERWQGLDIDYGHVVHGITLPDGSEAAFSHAHLNGEPWNLLEGAVWWSSRKMPKWLQERGVIYPPDSFTQQSILDNEADDGMMGFGRKIPPWWSKETSQ